MEKDTPYDPEGWNDQISDGGEPMLRAGLMYQRSTVETKWFDSTLRAWSKRNADTTPFWD